MRRAPERDAPDFEQWFWNNVDDSGDGCWWWLGDLGQKGYGRYPSADGRLVTAHRTAWELTHGPIQGRALFDHECRNGKQGCVRPSHLRPATHKQNAENVGVRKDSSTGVRNVLPDGRSGKYIVKIQHNGKQRQYGRFDTIEEAAARAREVRAQLFTHCAD